MWWKLFLLALYLGALFLLSRVLETVSYYEGGYLASRILDPVSLSVRKLKLLLDQRGVSYAGVVEKQELTELIHNSGDALTGELDAANNNAKTTPSSTNFTGGAHFYEEVEDTKDSVWLVQVISGIQAKSFMESHDWQQLTRMLHTFGVRTGFFHCTHDRNLCQRKAWYSSRLVLAVPRGFRSKDKVILRSYTGTCRIQAVFDWVNTHLASRMHEIDSWQTLIDHWLQPKKLDQGDSGATAEECETMDLDRKQCYGTIIEEEFSCEGYTSKLYTEENPHVNHYREDSSQEKETPRKTTPQNPQPKTIKTLTNDTEDRGSGLSVLFFSHMTIPPMFLSVLSVKFTGRVKFGTVNTKSREGKNIVRRLKLTKVPRYLVVTSDNTYTFGGKKGEYWNYPSMALFLKTLHPEVNDVFLLSLVIVNVMCWLEFFIARGTLFKRLGSLMWLIGKWNFLLILLWLPLLGVYKLPSMHRALDHVLRLLQGVALTPLGRELRSDWLWYLSDPAFLPATFLAFACIVGLLHKFIGQSEQATDTNNNLSAWWQLDWETCMSAFFRPVASLTRPMQRNDDLEVGMEMLIERLAVPNLWLRPMISTEYIQELPDWKYTGLCIDSDIGSDVASEGEGYLSDADSVCSASSEGSRRPTAFICQRCRALSENAEKSDEELRQQDLETESALVKTMMDGDYKCQCTQHTPRRDRKHTRVRAKRKPEEEANIETESTERPEGMIDSDECAICLERYRREATLCGLPCGHAFHKKCILDWLNRDNHVCPVCRWPSYKAKPCSRHAYD